MSHKKRETNAWLRQPIIPVSAHPTKSSSSYRPGGDSAYLRNLKNILRLGIVLATRVTIYGPFNLCFIPSTLAFDRVAP